MKYASYGEVFRQGECLQKTFTVILSLEEDLKQFFDVGDFDEVVFVACGSSYWLSTAACMTFQQKTGIRASAVTSGDVVMQPDYYLKAYSKPLVIAPSRSGSTTETLIALKLFRETCNSRVLSLVENPEAAIAAVSDYIISMPWANETSVCQTRSFSNLYMASVLIAAVLIGDTPWIEALGKYINTFDQHSQKAEQTIGNLIHAFPQWKSLVTLGSGVQTGVAFEGAYICIEMAQFPSNYYATMELRHGPIVMLDDTALVCLFSGGKGRIQEETIAQDARNKGAKVAAITAVDNFVNTDIRFNLGWDAPPEITALYGIMVMQGFAHLKAVDLGIDPDNPKDLVPWIKL